MINKLSNQIFNHKKIVKSKKQLLKTLSNQKINNKNIVKLKKTH